MLNVPELVRIALYQRGIARVLAIDGKKCYIVGLIDLIERRVANTPGIALHFLDCGTRTGRAFKSDSWGGGNTFQDILFKGKVRSFEGALSRLFRSHERVQYFYSNALSCEPTFCYTTLAEW